MNRRKEVILLSLQCTRRGVDSGRHKLRYATFYEFFRKFRILKLLAYCHPTSRSHELRKIGVERMMRESGKLHRLCLAVGTPREGYAQNLAGSNRIIGKSFIKVAHTKQEYRIGMFLLHLQILEHKGCLCYFCHLCLSIIRRLKASMSTFPRISEVRRHHL